MCHDITPLTWLNSRRRFENFNCERPEGEIRTKQNSMDKAKSEEYDWNLNRMALPIII